MFQRVVDDNAGDGLCFGPIRLQAFSDKTCSRALGKKLGELPPETCNQRSASTTRLTDSENGLSFQRELKENHIDRTSRTKLSALRKN